ncbi:hypothetical protein C0992_003816, partial [Termitomyces sp. T32_za158]
MSHQPPFRPQHQRKRASSSKKKSREELMSINSASSATAAANALTALPQSNLFETTSDPKTKLQNATNPSIPAPTMAVPGKINVSSQFPLSQSTTSMTGIASPMGNSSSLRSEDTKRPVGAIVGGVLGGLFGLTVIAAAILYCRRKRRNSSNLTWWTTRDTNVSPSPSSEEDWYTKTAMDVDVSGNTSAPPDYGYQHTTAWQNPNMIKSKDLTSGRTKEEEFESEQARRREEIYGRMRRVLDSGSDAHASKESGRGLP